MTEPAFDRWPQTQQLIMLAFNDDLDIAHLAAQELLARIRIKGMGERAQEMAQEESAKP